MVWLAAMWKFPLTKLIKVWIQHFPQYQGRYILKIHCMLDSYKYGPWCVQVRLHGLAWPAKACLLMASKLKLVGVTSSWRRKNISNQWMMLEIDFESTHRQVRSHRSKGVFLLCMVGIGSVLWWHRSIYMLTLLLCCLVADGNATRQVLLNFKQK